MESYVVLGNIDELYFPRKYAYDTLKVEHQAHGAKTSDPVINTGDDERLILRPGLGLRGEARDRVVPVQDGGLPRVQEDACAWPDSVVIFCQIVMPLHAFIYFLQLIS